MTGIDGDTLGGEPGPGERTRAPSRGAGLPPDSAQQAEIPDPRPSGKTRRAGSRRRPSPAPAQQQLMARISAGRRARQRRALLMASGAMSALVLLAAGSAFALTSYVNGHLGRVNADTVSAPSRGPLNILVAGLDQRAGLTRRQQLELHVGRKTAQTITDTLMVVHVSADHRYVTVVSLPHNSWVSIPGHDMNNMDATLGLGGPGLMVRTVEHDTGLPIDEYIAVNFLGFVKVIDALGGVNICVPHAVNDRYSGLRMSAGLHHVNGITALKYARDRHSFATALTEAISSGVLANPVRLARVLSAASAAISVGQRSSVANMADELSGISPSQVTSTTVPLANVKYITPSGQPALLWDSSAASALFTALKNDQLPPKTQAGKPPVPALGRGQVSLDVYNGTLIGGLSAGTGTRLAALGFRVDRSGVIWMSQNITQTLILYPAGQEMAAQLVRQVMPGAALQQLNGLTRLSIVVGRRGHTVTARSPSTPGQPSSTQLGPGRSPWPSQQKTAAQDACPR